MANAVVSGQLSERQRSLAFATVLIAFVMDVVDSTIVNTALPAIQTALTASDGAMQWVVSGYFLTFAVLLVVGGRLGDLFGYARMFVIGVVGFTLASLACGLARDGSALSIARLAQGAAAAIMAPQGVALIQLLYSPTERIGRLAAFGVIGGLAAIGGPVIGGLLIEWSPLGLGWRSVFLINLPFGVLALIAGLTLLPPGRSGQALRPDVPGTLLLFAALGTSLLPLIEGRAAGWPWWTAVAGIASTGLWYAFWSYEQRRRTVIGSALIEPSLFADSSFRIGLTATAGFAMASAGFLLTFSLTLQRGLDYAPIDVALLHVPFGLGVMAGISQIGRKALPRHGRRVPMTGALTMATGCLATALALWMALPTIVIGGALLLAGIGMGTLSGPLGPITLAHVDRNHAGVAGAMHKTVQQIGGALGTALIATIYFTIVPDQRQQSIPAAFLVTTAVVALDLLILVLLLRRLPERLFER
ncbi:MFS transporter [Sphingomonas sp. Leaf67]|uniref:MFS transporter n=1 Tax=Sphingomonas sp. Leaf67 TaxID=1736230 RepID=UPI000A7E57FC|nr:MFS transporter [Sphingomonas sp. Leaf67]